MNTEPINAETLRARSPKRPLLRYFGGKWQLRHWIIQHFPAHRFYAEPFAGGASVLLGKEPAPGGEIVNDLNGELINLFRVMQSFSQSQELQRKLEWTPYAAAELKAARELIEEPVERARRMLVRSFMGIEVSGINGNRHTGLRMGNVSLRTLDQTGKRTFRNCAKDWSHWKAEFPVIRHRLAEVMIYEMDALKFIALMDSPETLQFVDPPYHHATRTATRYVVDFEAHEQLVNLLLNSKSMFVVSGYDAPEYEPLVKAGWKRVVKDYRANMSLRRRQEVLWISPNAARIGEEIGQKVAEGTE